MNGLDYSRLSACTRIIVDGDPGAGKTSLAVKISSDLRFEKISFDDYLLENGQPYLKQIEYEKLKKDISSGGPKIVIEGLFTLAILQKIGVMHDFHIFIKLINGFCGWDYENYLLHIAKPPKSKLTREVVEYYRAYKPFEACNLILSRDLTVK